MSLGFWVFLLLLWLYLYKLLTCSLSFHYSSSNFAIFVSSGSSLSMLWQGTQLFLFEASGFSLLLRAFSVSFEKTCPAVLYPLKEEGGLHIPVFIIGFNHIWKFLPNSVGEFSYCASIDGKSSSSGAIEKVKGLVTQSCLALCHPMDCGPPGSSVHRILQARILEWVAIPFSRASSGPKGQTWFSCVAGIFFYCLSHQGTSCYVLMWSDRELMLLNCGVGEDSWGSLGLQGDPTSQS